MISSWLRKWRNRHVPVEWVPCPHCGADIPESATFCRHCGSSDSDGWRDEFDGGYEDSEDDFDYEQYVREHHSPSATSSTLSPVWRFVVIALVVAFAASLVVPLL